MPREEAVSPSSPPGCGVPASTPTPSPPSPPQLPRPGDGRQSCWKVGQWRKRGCGGLPRGSGGGLGAAPAPGGGCAHAGLLGDPTGTDVTLSLLGRRVGEDQSVCPHPLGPTPCFFRVLGDSRRESRRFHSLWPQGLSWIPQNKYRMASFLLQAGQTAPGLRGLGLSPVSPHAHSLLRQGQLPTHGLLLDAHRLPTSASRPPGEVGAGDRRTCSL